MKKPRVVITGIGVVSPLGIGKDEFWKNCFAGKSAVKTISLFDTASLKVKKAGEITDLDVQSLLGKKGLVDLDRATRLLLCAAKFALEDSALELSEDDKNRTGIVIGSTFGSLNSLAEFDWTSMKEGPNFVNASRFPNTVINSPASRMAIRFGIKGVNATISTGTSAAVDALHYAIDAVRAGRVDRVLVGAVEELCLQTLLGLQSLKYLSGLKGEPLSCPFDQRRDGIVFSEGSVVLLVEKIETAEQRRGRIYGEVRAVSSVFDPYRLYRLNPAGTGMIEAMRKSMEGAGVLPEDIECIFANANSTQDADAIEAKAIQTIFGKETSQPLVSAIKSMLGETLSAAGAFNIAAALGSLEKQKIPPVINYTQKDPDCPVNLVADNAVAATLNNVLLNAFSPHGSYTSVVLTRHSEAS